MVCGVHGVWHAALLGGAHTGFVTFVGYGPYRPACRALVCRVQLRRLKVAVTRWSARSARVISCGCAAQLTHVSTDSLLEKLLLIITDH